MPRLLIVEDERAVRFGMRMFFEDHDYEVVEADSLARARAQLGAGTTDAAIIDGRLPDGDGTDLLPLRVPAILLTGSRVEERRADRVLLKPVPLRVLLDIVREMLAA